MVKAFRTTAPPSVDGKVDAWPWSDGTRVVALSRTHDNLPSKDFTGRALAVYDDQALYLALDISLPKGGVFNSQNKVEWSFRGADGKQTTPVFVLSCTADGDFHSLTAMGASAAQAMTLKTGTRYATARTATGWTCQWRVPWTALGVSPAKLPKVWPMNIGVLSSGTWLVWVPTGGRICNVDEAGELHLADR